MSADEYNKNEIAAGRLTPSHITTLTREFQKTRGLGADGMAGPTTRKALEALSAPIVALDLDARLAEAGRKAVIAAERYWSLDIFDPKTDDHSPRAEFCRQQIESFLRACGWTWKIPYHGDGYVQWCGIFAGACWREAGLDPAQLASFWASTIRLAKWGTYRPWESKENPKPAQGPYRLWHKINPDHALPFEPREGDILIVGDGDPAEGDHITLLKGYDRARRVFITVEGNGGGVGPKGNRREGVVHAERPLTAKTGYRAMFIGRPAPHDLVL